jgi:hypothetical protein
VIKVTSYPNYAPGRRENAFGTAVILSDVRRSWGGIWPIAISGDYSGACEYPSFEIAINECIPDLLDNFFGSEVMRFKII